MEKICARCGKGFNASTEEQSVCPACLSDEFASVKTSRSVEVNQLVAQNEIVHRRQVARAERMARTLQSGSAFSLMGKVRCGLSVGLFLICVLIFVIGDSETVKTPINQMEQEYQLYISIGVALISSLFLLPSFATHKFIISISIVTMLSMGVAMPFMWHARVPGIEPQSPTALEGEEEKKETQEEDKTRRFLSDGDLEVFHKTCEERPRETHFAIYLDNQTSSIRSQVRESLTRLMQAEFTRAYTRGSGALYIVTNARGNRSNVARVASRYGRVVYANAGAGIYEVSFSPDKANLVSRYSSEVLSSPQNLNFVSANVSELLCLDPMRVSAAANMLATANVQVLRGDIRDAIVQVLHDPWSSEEETYQALIEALTVYAPRGDREALQYLMAYFNNCRTARKKISPKVTRRLIGEEPAAMVEPIVQLWLDNPLAWNEMLSALGPRAEEVLISRLNPEADLHLLDSLMKYLSTYGSSKAIPSLEKLLEHPDSLVRHKAGATINDIKSRY